MFNKFKLMFEDFISYLFMPFFSKQRVILIKNKRKHRRLIRHRNELQRMLDESW